MARPQLKLTLLAMLTIAGCSQILGINDYDIDKNLDGPVGGDGNQGGDGNGGSDAGRGNQAGTRNNMGGEPSNMGGEPGNTGGVAGTPGGGTAGAAGAGGGDAGAAGMGGDGSGIIPCSSSNCCSDAGGIVEALELLPNGDFETGRAAWGMSSENGYAIFTKQTASTIDANSGTWFAWIGGNVSDIGIVLSPEFIVPADTGWLGLEGYRFFAFDSLAMTGDYADVGIYSTDDDGAASEYFFEWNNYEFDTDQWEIFEAEIPAAAYLSNPYSIGITGVTDDLSDADPEDPDGQFASNFFFDDISFKAFTCKKP